jgi:hypothetical protein
MSTLTAYAIASVPSLFLKSLFCCLLLPHSVTRFLELFTAVICMLVHAKIF